MSFIKTDFTKSKSLVSTLKRASEDCEEIARLLKDQAICSATYAPNMDVGAVKLNEVAGEISGSGQIFSSLANKLSISVASIEKAQRELENKAKSLNN